MDIIVYICVHCILYMLYINCIGNYAIQIVKKLYLEFIILILEICMKSLANTREKIWYYMHFNTEYKTIHIYYQPIDIYIYIYIYI